VAAGNDDLRQAYRNAGAAGEQPAVGTGLTDTDQILIADRIDNDQHLAARRRSIKRTSNRQSASGDLPPRYQPDRTLRLK
jgi:hypothetical protein